MVTSIVVYLPRTGRKDTLAAIADLEYQMRMRIKRRQTSKEWCELTHEWRNCRRDPGLWELKLTLCG
jgi:hypothetical protein